MEKTQRMRRLVLWPVLGALTALTLAACMSKEAKEVPAVDLSELARRFVDPDHAVGALVLGKDGEIIAVDATGKPVAPCALAPEEGATASAPVAREAEEPECAKIRGTTLTNIQSTAIVRHTGSTCTTVGPIISGGRAYYFQLPQGCTK